MAMYVHIYISFWFFFILSRTFFLNFLNIYFNLIYLKWFGWFLLAAHFSSLVPTSFIPSVPTFAGACLCATEEALSFLKEEKLKFKDEMEMLCLRKYSDKTNNNFCGNNASLNETCFDNNEYSMECEGCFDCNEDSTNSKDDNVVH